jgi:hypothetical protein|tara:strand:+ start:313 stop:447 length:135 start_codon:yes stop_codon:yes gene_type:complete
MKLALYARVSTDFIRLPKGLQHNPLLAFYDFPAEHWISSRFTFY